MVEKRTYGFIVAALLAWSITATSLTSYYYVRYTTYREEYKNVLTQLENISNGTRELSLGLETVSGQFGDFEQTLENISETLESISLKVNILINYGNENKEWHNETMVPIGATAFTATLAVAEVQYKIYDWGVYVTSINSVAEKSTESKAWFWWYWDATASQWVLAEVGADQYVLHREDIVAWAYQSYVTWPPPPPS